MTQKLVKRRRAPKTSEVGVALSAEAVRKQLARIFASPDFIHSPRNQEFLKFVVEETLAGRGNHLKAYTIGVKLLKRAPDFDSLVDPIVRIQAGRVRRALEHYYLTRGGNDPVRLEIPKGTYQPVWSSKTPDGTKLTARGLPAEEAEPEPGLPSELSIAVVPFVNFLSDPSYASFTEGLTEELITSFSCFRDFRVVYYPIKPGVRNRTLGLDEIASKVRAHFLLFGRVRQMDQAIKVTAMLNDAITAESLWSENYIRQLTADNLFAVQHEIAARIAGVLADQYGVIFRAMIRQAQSRGTHAPSLHEMVFYYRHIGNTREGLIKVMTALEQAITQAPNDAFAHAFLATAHYKEYMFGFDISNKALDRSIELAYRALALDPYCQEAEMALAYTYLFRREIEQSTVHAERCVALNPNASYYVALIAYCMAICGKWDHALKLARHSKELSPNYPTTVHFIACLDHIRRGEYAGALAEANQYSVPFSYWGPLGRAAALGLLGRGQDSHAAIGELLLLRPDFAEHANLLVHRLTFDEKLATRILEGLVKAGLDVAGEGGAHLSGDTSA